MVDTYIALRAEDAYQRSGRFGAFGDLAARVLNYAPRERESAIYERAILLGCMVLEDKDRAQHLTIGHSVTNRAQVQRHATAHGHWRSIITGHLRRRELGVCRDHCTASMGPTSVEGTEPSSQQGNVGLLT
jgi:hypothetical protein